MHRDPTYLLPLRTGWAPGPGQSAEFPPDLPEDWRLGWFASEHLGVLVPQETWLRADEPELETWREDTPERFRFYLTLASGSHESSQKMLRAVARVLGGRFGGIVAEPGALRGDWPEVSHRWLLAPQPSPDAPPPSLGVAAAGCLALPCPAELIRDPPGARRWLETLAGAAASDPPAAPASGLAILLLLGWCRLDDLRRWQQLVELMGLSF